MMHKVKIYIVAEIFLDVGLVEPVIIAQYFDIVFRNKNTHLSTYKP